jgi:hypothetical protein
MGYMQFQFGCCNRRSTNTRHGHLAVVTYIADKKEVEMERNILSELKQTVNREGFAQLKMGTFNDLIAIAEAARGLLIAENEYAAMQDDEHFGRMLEKARALDPLLAKFDDPASWHKRD